MIGPLGGRRLQQAPTDPAPTLLGRHKPTSRVLTPVGPWCVCGHSIRAHSDRCITACDGDYQGGATTTRTGPRGPLCDCTGWQRNLMEASA